ncbi:CoA-binding protein [Pseudothermotoga sp.]|nr:CoA-binding protein [Pseudothermotoga sp.]MCX7813109.1 CoA-binding protein [Pseudothermotoga sp.]MDW8140177.1 CoA-binding protein [Pseudothermotoga sp.]
MDLSGVRKIAVVGASEDRRKYGNKIVRDLSLKGFEVYPVNPKAESIEGIKTYRDIEELPKDVDLIVLVVPPEIGIQVVEKAIRLGFKRLWFQPGAGSKQIEDLLKNNGIEYSFGRCIMVETSF